MVETQPEKPPVTGKAKVEFKQDVEELPTTCGETEDDDSGTDSTDSDGNRSIERKVNVVEHPTGVGKFLRSRYENLIDVYDNEWRESGQLFSVARPEATEHEPDQQVDLSECYWADALPHDVHVSATTSRRPGGHHYKRPKSILEICTYIMRITQRAW